MNIFTNVWCVGYLLKNCIRKILKQLEVDKSQATIKTFVFDLQDNNSQYSDSNWTFSKYQHVDNQPFYIIIVQNIEKRSVYDYSLMYKT